MGFWLIWIETVFLYIFHNKHFIWNIVLVSITPSSPSKLWTQKHKKKYVVKKTPALSGGQVHFLRHFFSTLMALTKSLTANLEWNLIFFLFIDIKLQNVAELVHIQRTTILFREASISEAFLTCERWPLPSCAGCQEGVILQTNELKPLIGMQIKLEEVFVWYMYLSQNKNYEYYVIWRKTIEYLMLR